MSCNKPLVDSSEDESDFSDGLLSPVTSTDSESDGIVTVSEAAQEASDVQASAARTAQAISPRAYQLEMLQRSLDGNVIVVMDTGSGKTQVAVMRIKAELEKTGHNKIIWFLAPTVSLCEQQFNVIRVQVAYMRTKLLTGKDNVDTWNEQTWKAALDGTRIIVTTYQVLLDALSNAFVRMDWLSLIVFDEAHNCVEKHPGSKLMRNFYHGRRDRGGTLPSILGLTATPSFNSTIEGREALEATLDALCVSPTLHREALLSHVKKPTICAADYTNSALLQSTSSMQSLQDARSAMNIHEDPYVLHLKAEPNERNRRKLERAIETKDTYSQVQINSLWTRCGNIHDQLGPWAADMYLWKASTSYQKRLDQSDDSPDHLLTRERRYVAALLEEIALKTIPPRPQKVGDISDKAHVLLNELMSVEGPVVGIVFVRERSTVTMLCQLLESCPAIVEKFRIGSMVGSSRHPGRRNLFEFSSDTDTDGLEAFRAGNVNLLVATSVLEEGIDIPACNLIVCFDMPANHKAYLQRCGRARMHESKLILLIEHTLGASRTVVELQRVVDQAFEEEQIEVRHLLLLEDSEPGGTGYFEVKETGAVLDYDNAKQRLQHFCDALSPGEFIDGHPDYILHRHTDTSPTQWSATVLLPSLVPEELRRVDGKSTWLSQKNATKEVAFEACVALFRAGLLDQHLLPFRLNVISAGQTRASKEKVDPAFDPWLQVTEAWQSGDEKWLYPLVFEDDNHMRSEYELLLPLRVEHFRPMELFRSFGARCQLQFGAARPISAHEAALLPDQTPALLAASFSHRWPVEDRPTVARFMIPGEQISRAQIGCAKFDARNEKHTSGLYLVRDASGVPFRYLGLVSAKPSIELVRCPFQDYDLAPTDVPYLVLERLTKRINLLKFLHTGGNVKTGTYKPYAWVLPEADALIDEIPMKHVHFGLMIPSILHELEVLITTKQLATTQLQSVGITDLSLVREARSARGASEPVNYERLEFLGDTILKYCTSMQAAADKPAWPEGYLATYRDSVVSNSRLCRATLDSGIAKFILTSPFNGKKWRPVYLDRYPDRSRDEAAQARTVSTKTLADVVESLIGASYVDGGDSKATACLSKFLSEECEWHQVDHNRLRLYELARSQDALPPVMEPLERLIGYSFRKKALLIEAMTHGSYALDTSRRSYERLEFLGDAMLDKIIVTSLFSLDLSLSQYQMTSLKTAMVNGDFLAFVVMENSPGEGVDDLGPVWRYMRHGSYTIGSEQKAMLTRHEALRREIREAMMKGRRYPWALLARLQAKKFVSDLFEALLGAIWVDSGSMDACKAMVGRFGILAYLEYMLRNHTDARHPKQELGEWAGRQKVKYEVDVGDGGGGGGKARYTCRVRVGDTVVGLIEDGLDPEEAQVRAADKVMRRVFTERVELDT
ncbi:hypothetical protein L249_0383 [Ophiocordyceps polyrhachis-furcata BCC 54312]|uniref:Dicer-like protein 2 n=1 Tax=Ophiocordyceps polyrhachis-furcata BCC 54312 TaxID=1330021 RepID=A0A367LCK5_9HYPO|nr:hypothetical protein L249_0383 [Ophiocordyceps polyrhachis-furcata BCC 54312]